MSSLDPRINRLDLLRQEQNASADRGKNENWPAFEVFHQAKRGQHHKHVGTVHAPDAQMALVFAKEQFGRRQTCVNMWVVKTSDIISFSYNDVDMFETTPGKLHREATGYKLRDKVEKYKQQQRKKADKK